MKRVIILCGALALAAAVGISAVQETEGPRTAPALPASLDTSVVVRRVYEGPTARFWGNSPSPDGRYLTQTDWETGDLAVLDLLTGQKRRVTENGDDGWEFAFSESARFSPDGQQIAFTWYAEPGTYELRVINVDGSGSRTVARADRDPEEWEPDLLHGWHPDGRRILVTLEYGTRRELTLFSVADGSREILCEYPSGNGPQGHVLSPDGRYLAYEEKDDVFVMPLEGGDPVPVASGASEDALVGWTEEGNLLFISDRELTKGLWRVPMQNGRPSGEAVLVAGDLWGIRPMGVAGNSLVYGIFTQFPRIHVLPLDLAQNRLTGIPSPIEPEMREGFFPSWSPDGQNILFLWRQGPSGRLMLRSMAGGETQDVTPPSLIPMLRDAQWSEDGRQILIAATERDSGRRGFYAYTLATGEIEHVFSPQDVVPETPGTGRNGTSFSSDWGTWFISMTEGSGTLISLLRVDLAEGTERKLWSRPAQPEEGRPPPVRVPYTSPDDRLLAFWEHTRPDTARMLRLISTEGGEPRTLLTERLGDEEEDFQCPGGVDPLWSSDSRYLLTILRGPESEGKPRPPNPCGVYKVPVEGGDLVYVGAIPEHGYTWALSPDDRRLAFPMGESRGEIWILQGLEGRREP